MNTILVFFVLLYTSYFRGVSLFKMNLKKKINKKDL